MQTSNGAMQASLGAIQATMQESLGAMKTSMQASLGAMQTSIDTMQTGMGALQASIDELLGSTFTMRSAAVVDACARASVYFVAHDYDSCSAFVYAPPAGAGTPPACG